MGYESEGVYSCAHQDNWALWPSISQNMLLTRDRYFTVFKEQTDGTPGVERSCLWTTTVKRASGMCNTSEGNLVVRRINAHVNLQRQMLSEWHVTFGVLKISVTDAT